MNQIASHFRRLGETDPQDVRVPLGQMLLDEGDLTVGELLSALSEHKKLGVPLGLIAVSRGLISETTLYDRLALQWNMRRFRPNDLMDAQLIDAVGLPFCLKHKVIPVEMVDGLLFLATSDVSRFSEAERDLEDQFGLISPAIGSPKEIEAAMARSFPADFAEQAATELPMEHSCRGLANHAKQRVFWGISLSVILTVLIIFFPTGLVLGLTIVSILLSMSSAILKTSALTANLISGRQRDNELPLPKRLPKVSILVPLHREPDVAKVLVKRLERLTYPKPLLEILLVIEENDDVTKTAVQQAQLPPWMWPVTVPEGSPKTKP